MNKRLRQQLWAEHVVDKCDPPMVASVPVGDGPWREVLIFRQSEFEEMRRKYGEELRIMYEMPDFHTPTNIRKGRRQHGNEDQT